MDMAVPLLNAALSGKLLKVEYHKDAVFGFDVPQTCEGVPAEILDPANTWPSRGEYYKKYDALAARFIENFKLMVRECPEHVLEAGPKRLAATPRAVTQGAEPLAGFAS